MRKNMKVAKGKVKISENEVRVIKGKANKRKKAVLKLRYRKWNVSPAALDEVMSNMVKLSMKISKLRGKYLTNKKADELGNCATKIFYDLTTAVKKSAKKQA